MLAFQEFLKRVGRYWKFQWGIFTSVVDWVVALYFIVPGLLIAGYHYMQLWQMNDVWPEQLSLSLLVLVLFIWTFMGRVQFFVEEADQLIVRQQSEIFKRIQLYSLLYSFCRAFFRTVVLFILLAPILLLYLQLEAKVLILSFALTIGAKAFQQIYKTYSYLPFQRWKKWLVDSFVFVANLLIFLALAVLLEIRYTGAFLAWLPIGEGFSSLIAKVNNWNVNLFLFMAAITVLYVLSTVLLARERISLAWSFSYDSARAREEKYRAVAFLLQQSMQYLGGPDVRVKKRRGRKNFLLGLLLPSRGLSKRKQQDPDRIISSLFIRFVGRSKDRVFNLLRLTSVFVSALILTPGLLKWGMWLLALGVLVFYARDLWREWVQHDYIQLFARRFELRRRAGVKAILSIVLPPIVLLSFIIGILVHSVWLGILMIVVGSFISLGMTSIIRIELGKQKENQTADEPDSGLEEKAK